MYTPSLDTGILGGVTRRYVIERLADMGIEVMQGVYPLKELLFADEAWMTNSVQEIVPFRRIGSTEEIQTPSLASTTKESLNIIGGLRQAAIKRKTNSACFFVLYLIMSD